MTGRLKEGKVTNECKETGCLKIYKRKCLAFKDPEFQWKDGKKCWGYTNELSELRKIITDICAYSKVSSWNPSYQRDIRECIKKLEQGVVCGDQVCGLR